MENNNVTAWTTKTLRSRILSVLDHFWNTVAPSESDFIDLNTLIREVYHHQSITSLSNDEADFLFRVIEGLAAEGQINLYPAGERRAIQITPKGRHYLTTISHADAPFPSISSKNHYVILVHGIRDNGSWQDDVERYLRTKGFTTKPVEWDPISTFWFGVPWPLSLLLFWYPNNIHKRYQTIIQDLRHTDKQLASQTKISFIAHSFGAWSVSQCVRRFGDVNAYRIILCGSVARRQMKWPSLRLGRFADGTDAKVNSPNILNYCGVNDIWPTIACYVNFMYGSSGKTGFLDREKTHSRYFDGGHSDALTPTFAEAWTTFLDGGDATSVPTLSIECNRPGALVGFHFILRYAGALLCVLWQGILLIAAVAAIALIPAWRGCDPRPFPCGICDTAIYDDDIRFAVEVRSVIVRNGLEREYPLAGSASQEVANPDDVMIDVVNDRDADVVVLFRDISHSPSLSNDKAGDQWRAYPLGAGSTVHDIRMSGLTIQSENTANPSPRPYSGDYAVFVYDCKECSVLGVGDSQPFPVHRLVPARDSVRKGDPNRTLRVLARPDESNSVLRVEQSFR